MIPQSSNSQPPVSNRSETMLGMCASPNQQPLSSIPLPTRPPSLFGVLNESGTRECDDGGKIDRVDPVTQRHGQPLPGLTSSTLPSLLAPKYDILDKNNASGITVTITKPMGSPSMPTLGLHASAFPTVPALSTTLIPPTLDHFGRSVSSSPFLSPLSSTITTANNTTTTDRSNALSPRPSTLLSPSPSSPCPSPTLLPPQTPKNPFKPVLRLILQRATNIYYNACKQPTKNLPMSPLPTANDALSSPRPWADTIVRIATMSVGFGLLGICFGTFLLAVTHLTFDVGSGGGGHHGGGGISHSRPHMSFREAASHGNFHSGGDFPGGGVIGGENRHHQFATFPSRILGRLSPIPMVPLRPSQRVSSLLCRVKARICQVENLYIIDGQMHVYLGADAVVEQWLLENMTVLTGIGFGSPVIKPVLATDFFASENGDENVRSSKDDKKAARRLQKRDQDLTFHPHLDERVDDPFAPNLSHSSSGLPIDTTKNHAPKRNISMSEQAAVDEMASKGVGTLVEDSVPDTDLPPSEDARGPSTIITFGRNGTNATFPGRNVLTLPLILHVEDPPVRLPDDVRYRSEPTGKDQPF
ncbi:hypothetical protein HK102_003409 [Quaeritorhiza haematococci]|nr:hypothetical protein HK102_003409 [Quaeritorhiza haematococci]